MPDSSPPPAPSPATTTAKCPMCNGEGCNGCNWTGEADPFGPSRCNWCGGKIMRYDAGPGCATCGAVPAPLATPCPDCGGEGKRVEDGGEWGCATCNGGGWVEAPQASDAPAPPRETPTFGTKARLTERLTLLERSADRLAYEVGQLVDRHVISARSDAGDALLDYADVRHPDAEHPIGCIERPADRWGPDAASPAQEATPPRETSCTCGVGTVFYSHLHPADCPFSRAGVLPPKSREQKLADRLAEIAQAAGKVRDAEYEYGVLRYSHDAVQMHFQRDEERVLHKALQRLVYLATEATNV